MSGRSEQNDLKFDRLPCLRRDQGLSKAQAAVSRRDFRLGEHFELVVREFLYQVLKNNAIVECPSAQADLVDRSFLS